MKPEHIQKIAECEVEGLSRAEIAARVGLTPRTISRYRHRPEVVEAVEALRRRPRSERARDTLMGLLSSRSEQVRLAAATAVLRYGEKMQPTSEPPPEAAAAVVLRIEKDDDIGEIVIENGEIVE